MCYFLHLLTHLLSSDYIPPYPDTHTKIIHEIPRGHISRASAVKIARSELRGSESRINFSSTRIVVAKQTPANTQPAPKTFCKIYTIICIKFYLNLQ